MPSLCTQTVCSCERKMPSDIVLTHNHPLFYETLQKLLIRKEYKPICDWLCMLISFIGPRTKVKANIFWSEIWNIKYSYNRKLLIAPCCYETYIYPHIAVMILESHRTSTSVSEASRNASVDTQKRRRGKKERGRWCDFFKKTEHSFSFTFWHIRIFDHF